MAIRIVATAAGGGSNVVLDSAQATAAQNDGAIYDSVLKKWDFTKRQWR